jgi:hypothetical protein
VRVKYGEVVCGFVLVLETKEKGKGKGEGRTTQSFAENDDVSTRLCRYRGQVSCSDGIGNFHSNDWQANVASCRACNATFDLVHFEV